MKLVADQIRNWVPGAYRVLGTDGFGRSDARGPLRSFFEVDRRWIALAALAELAEAGTVETAVVKKAIRKFGIDPDKPNPVSC